MKNILFALFFIWSADISADVPAEQVEEINHLLDFIRNSDCIMERNGSRHSTIDAIEHILKKYDYYRDEINNTEDFIRLAATKSTISGEYYKVNCQDEKSFRTQDWLMSELKRYRSE